MILFLRVVIGAAAVLASMVCFAAGSDRTFIVKDRSAARSPLPFSEGVVVGNTFYVAGHIGIDPATDRAAADSGSEAKLVMDAVKNTVEKAGFKMDDLVTVQVFCTDLALYDSFNSIYRTYFHEHFPARAFIGVDKLLRGAHFEVMGTAVKESR
jgi:2-iminobutanoate/2-iminopropanoate deaminase